MMQRGRTAIVVSVVLVAVIAAVFVLFFFRDIETPGVSLPEDIQSGGDQTARDNIELLTGVEITTDNVRDVIATLSRPEGYFREIDLTLYWSGGESLRTAEIWTRPQAVRVAYSDGENWIVTGDTYYFWSGSGGVQEGPVTDVLAGETGLERFLDQVQSIPSYESIQELEADEIVDAGYELLSLDGEQEYCIFVDCGPDSLGQTNRYYISVTTGLLVAAETWDGDEQTYGMETKKISLSTPARDEYVLPDGTDTLEGLD